MNRWMGSRRLFDHPRRERLGDQPSNSGVIGRLHVQDPVVDQMPERLVAGRRSVVTHLFVALDMQVGAAEPAVAQQRVDVFVPRDEPVGGGLVMHHRCTRAELLVHPGTDRR